MKRSHEPVFWMLFGAGGMLSALVGPVLIFITGIGVPLALLLPADTLDYARVLALVRHPVGQLGLLGVISLFLFHGCHRMLHSLHDLGVHTGAWARWCFYGFATVGSIATATVLLRIG